MKDNLCKLLILSVGFQLLFCVFNTSQNLASEVLDDLGYGDLGFYSLGALYLSFSLFCFAATPIVKKWGERSAMTIGAMCYTLYTASFVIASTPLKYPEKANDWFFSEGAIVTVILVTAVVNGFGAAILWVAQGRYISRIADDSNKGTYNSIFWAFFMSSEVIGTLFAALVLQKTDPFTFYCIMTIVCLFASLFFLFLRPVDPSTVPTTESVIEVVAEEN